VPDTQPANQDPNQIITYDSLASILDVQVKTVRQWKLRGGLPKPDISLGQSPGWKLSTLEPFIIHYKTHGRPGFQSRK
jgi:hypothetical protein